MSVQDEREDAAERVFIRGENGMVNPFDVPVPHHIATRLAKGDLVRVNEDGSPWAPDGTPSVPPAGDGAPAAAGLSGDAGSSTGGEDSDLPPLPAQSASRAVWQEYAVGQGMDPDEAAGMTKAQLVTRLTEAPPAP